MPLEKRQAPGNGEKIVRRSIRFSRLNELQRPGIKKGRECGRGGFSHRIFGKRRHEAPPTRQADTFKGFGKRRFECLYERELTVIAQEGNTVWRE